MNMYTSTLPIKAGQLAVVIGAGASGDAAARLLSALGLRVRMLDRKAENISDAFRSFADSTGIDVQCGEHSPGQFAGAALAVTSPGVPVHVLRPLLEQAAALPEHKEAGLGAISLLGEMELALSCVREPVLAVTGSSGKTTTVSLAAAMLEQAGKKVFLGGNIGTPLSAYVLNGGGADVLVLELSSFQLQGCSTIKPRAGIFLNLTENHLDHHKDMAEYAGAKFSMFALQDAEDVAILPEALVEEFHKRQLKGRLEVFADRGRFPHSRLAGKHNAANAEAAFLAAREFGVSEKDAAVAVAAFTPLRHRLELAGELNGVTYINDSKCTTVDSLRAALESFDGPVILMAGGKFKGGDLPALRELLKKKVRKVVLFGASREIFTAAWEGAVPIAWHGRMEPAFAEARLTAQHGDAVLLSPATSSYDLYKNYKERGDHFCRLVKELA